MYDHVITLLSSMAGTETDPTGDVNVDLSRKDVFADLKSVGMKENYQALAVGLKPELVFVLADYLDYDGQSEVEYKGLTYQVIRTYRKDTDELEMVVSRYADSEQREV